jgi:hypothetical protein
MSHAGSLTLEHPSRMGRSTAGRLCVTISMYVGVRMTSHSLLDLAQRCSIEIVRELSRPFLDEISSAVGHDAIQGEALDRQAGFL